MHSNLIDNPKLFRHLVEDLPMGVYIVDREKRICFWNHGAEHVTGYLSHEVVGRILEEVVQACDREGTPLAGDQRPVAMTLQECEPRQATVFYLHKNGHRIGVKVRTRPILEYGQTVGGASVLFEEAFVDSAEAAAQPMYGCLEATTGIPSRRLTRAVMYECMKGMEDTHIGFGLLRIRVLGLEDFGAKHGPQSVLPFLRATAHTLHHGMNSDSFLGYWDKYEFLAVLATASPMKVAMTAEALRNLLSHSEVTWWGDRFLVEAEVTYTVASPGDQIDSLLQDMKPCHHNLAAKSATAGAATHSASEKG